MRILESKRMITGSASSRLQFDSVVGPVISQRYLLLDGKRAYDLGNTCQTCALLFERLPGATKSLAIQEAAEALRHSVTSLDEGVVAAVGAGLPQDDYLTVLAETSIDFVRPGDPADYFVREQVALWGEDRFDCLPHDPRVPYYRAGSLRIGERRHLFNFVVPMYPTKWLTFRTVAEYMREMETRGTGTAVTLSLLDVKAPTDWEGEEHPDPDEHWLFTHYLIDGHHKLHAAAEKNKPLRLLSFVALSQGVSTPDQAQEALSYMF
jgi:hypothetical protein